MTHKVQRDLLTFAFEFLLVCGTFWVIFPWFVYWVGGPAADHVFEASERQVLTAIVAVMVGSLCFAFGLQAIQIERKALAREAAAKKRRDDAEWWIRKLTS